jgi:hypothetical protein
MRVHVQERQRNETGGREEALAALRRANLSFVLHVAARWNPHFGYGHRQGEEQSSCGGPVERAGGSGAAWMDLRHDSNADENGDREDENDQRPGCGVLRRDTPSR